MLLLARHLAGLPVLFVGVRCSIDIICSEVPLRRKELMSSRRAGSGAPAGTTMAGRVAQPGIHDLEVDTSLLTPQDCAEAIRLHLSSGPEPSAFRILTRLPVG